MQAVTGIGVGGGVPVIFFTSQMIDDADQTTFEQWSFVRRDRSGVQGTGRDETD